MALDAAQLLARAIEADEAREVAERRVALMEQRLQAALNAEPSTAVRALAWVGRAENAEQLVRQLLMYIDQRSIDARGFPAGWVARARAQMRAVDVMLRDLGDDQKRPSADDYWTTSVAPDGSRRVVRDTGVP